MKELSFMDNKPSIAIIGAGYVGLVSSVCFAELGFKVICVDKDQNKIKKLQDGHPAIYEPDLAPLLQDNLVKEHLRFSGVLSEAVLKSDVIFIAVGTPIKDDTAADTSEVEAVTKEIAPLLKCYKVIVVKSTVPVGTCVKLSKIILNLNHHAQFDMVSNPEFLRAGSGIQDFMTPDRIILGVETTRADEIMSNLYRYFINKKIPIVRTTLESAELIKYIANSFLAMKVAFVNEISSLCEKLNTDLNDVLRGISLDHRIGRDYLQPGPGFGGSCLNKDALTLTHMAKMVNVPITIIEAVLASNIKHKKRIIEKIVDACCGSVANKRLAILGIAFKANTDDIRESPALYLISELLSQGALLNLYDPVVKKVAFNLNVYWGQDVYDTLTESDVVIIMTEWDEFRHLDLKKVKSILRNTAIEPTLIDLRNLYSPQAVIAEGIRYYSIGKLTEKIA